MTNIDQFSIATLVIFFLPAIFVIHPITFHVPLPFVGKTRLAIDLMTAPIISIGALWAGQCIGPTQIRDGIVGTDGIKPYNVIILFISLSYMAITLDVTGVLQAAAFWVSNKGGNNGRKLYLYFYVFLTLLGVVLGSSPIILSGTPFVVYYTKATGLNPTSWLHSEFAASNIAGMVLFVGNATNMVICEGFGVKNAAFTAYTIFPFIACSLAGYGALAFQFRDPKHIPRNLSVTEMLDVREVLRDPVSAIFGSILLGVCLIVVMVLSFLQVDVWKIVLPFAGVKVVFDFCWDHYRYTTGRIPRLADTASEDASKGTDTKQALQPSTPAIEGDDTLSISRFSGLTLVRSPSPQSFTISPTPETSIYRSLAIHFPTFFTALSRLPIGLIPLAFSQFILIESLAHRGWLDVFATWLVKVTQGHMIPTIWIMGVLGVILSNVAGTNLGATILLTRVVLAAPNFPSNSARAAAIALAVASNIGAVSFTFSASLAGLLWNSILRQKKIPTKQTTFAFWNMLPLLAMTAVGLATVSAEMAVLHH